MSSACSRVFSTTELLEAILSHLPPVHLLHAQLISRTFNTLITSSPKLQQLLFFRPSSTKEWIINPLLRQHFLPWFVMPEEQWGPRRDYDVLKLMDWTKSPASLTAGLRVDASWRKMILVQPPAKELHVVRWEHGQGGTSEELATVTFPTEFVTMGRVYDVTESFLCAEYGSFATFGLAFRDGDAGPKMTLYLTSTMQCTGSRPANAALRSQGAVISYELEWKWGRTDGGDDDVSLNMDWKTDLTVERGGVEESEWEEWREKKGWVSNRRSNRRKVRE
jgi:hypothetical protein